jgi:hypothetical protein
MTIQLAPDAHDNGLATMLAALVGDNLEAKPQKKRDFATLRGTVSIVADDADVALTLRFDRGKLTIHDGIVGVPDVTVRGPSEVIMALSSLPLATPFGLPIPNPRNPEAVKTVRLVAAAVRTGRLHIYGMALHPRIVMKLTRLMSIHG